MSSQSASDLRPFFAAGIHKTAYDYCPDAFVVADAERRILAVNPAFEKLFGYRFEDVQGKQTRTLYENPDDPRHQGKLRYNASPACIDNRYQIRYRRKDGSVFVSETTGNAIFGADGALLGYVALIRNISGRIRLKELLESIIALSSDPNSETAAVVQDFLQAGTRYFGLESAMVTRVGGEKLTIDYVVDPTGNFSPEEVKDLGGTFCGAVVAADEVRSFHQAGLQEIATQRCYREQGLEAYVGAPLRIGGKLYGTLSFFGYNRRPVPFSGEDETLMRFLADWLAGFIEQSQQKAELERLSRELARAAGKFQRLYRETPAMLHSIDSDFRLVEVSDHWLERMGYDDRSEVLGRRVTEFHTPESSAKAERNIPNFWRTGTPVRERPYEFVRKDGTVFETELSAIVASPKSEAGGQSLAVIFDVTERNRAKRALERQAQTFERLYRETPAMLHSIDREGRLVEASDYWLQKMGYDSREEVIGRPIVEFHPPEQREWVDQCIAEFWSTGQPVLNRNYDFVRKDGSTFEAELSAIVMKPAGDSSARSLAVSFDVTERNRAWRELERKNTELERLNEELDTFASVASHDLQEPLRKIRKFAGIAQDELGDAATGDAAYALKVMRESAARMQTLVTDLLTYSRTANTAIETAPVDLASVVAEVLDDLSVQIAETRADIAVGPLPVVRGDRMHVQQLFQNLIKNAVRYRSPDRSAKISISVGKVDGVLHISVSDNGIGFTQAQAGQIFLPFMRLDPKARRDGSGLGLTICARIAERHGWSLQTRSEPDRGSTFTVVIPAGSACPD